MDNEPMQHRDPAQDELARRLRAYADARLSPELSATTRMRARVMAAAHRQVALQRADADRAAAIATALAQADRTRRSAWRRPLTALLAAGLTLGVGVGSVAAAQPGGPLYPVRIWTETLTLPANANEHAQAELHRLETRLAEAAAATAAGDNNAANAALEAYTAIVQEATDDVGNDVAAAAILDTGVRSNIDVLTVLVGQVPTDQARDAIQRAIDRSDSALDGLPGKPTDTPGNGPPSANPGLGPTDHPNADPTKKPHPSPKPKPTPESQPTPAHTPRGAPPSELPGGGAGNAGG
jgi:hypothetical protein